MYENEIPVDACKDKKGIVYENRLGTFAHDANWYLLLPRWVINTFPPVCYCDFLREGAIPPKWSVLISVSE